MDTIFTLGEQPDEGRDLNLDDLYESQKQRSLEDVALYNKILSRIHTKIRTASRLRDSDKTCWYLIPETLIGVPRYDVRECTAYLIDKLRRNGLAVRYTHPNLLLIGWGHWVPSYVRSEIKKKTGVSLTGLGSEKEHKKTGEPTDPTLLLSRRPMQQPQEPRRGPKQKVYKDIESYQPSGASVYGDAVLKAIHIGKR